MVGAMHRVPARGEEDRMRHAGIVPFLRVMHHLHAERLVGAGGRGKAGGAGRDAPAIGHLAVDGDGHDLGRLVDLDKDGGERGLAGRAGQAKRKQRDGEKPEPFHSCRFPSWPRDAAVPCVSLAAAKPLVIPVVDPISHEADDGFVPRADIALHFAASSLSRISGQSNRVASRFLMLSAM